MEFINLLGYDIILNDTLISSQGRASMESDIEELDSTVPLLEIKQGGIINLPDPVSNTLYIVTGVVAAEAGIYYDRTDVFTPSRIEKSKPPVRIGALARITAKDGFK